MSSWQSLRDDHRKRSEVEGLNVTKKREPGCQKNNQQLTDRTILSLRMLRTATSARPKKVNLEEILTCNISAFLHGLRPGKIPYNSHMQP